MLAFTGDGMQICGFGWSVTLRKQSQCKQLDISVLVYVRLVEGLWAGSNGEIDQLLSRGLMGLRLRLDSASRWLH